MVGNLNSKLINKNVGVLALQGAFLEHQELLEQLGLKVAQVRKIEQLENLEYLIIPGGESTAQNIISESFVMKKALQDFIQTKKVWGTCAGMIMLANNILNQEAILGGMNITVQRNAFGRQQDSFIEDIKIPSLTDFENPFESIFIRAPKIMEVDPVVEVLAQTKCGDIVAAREGNILVTAFHPELTQDVRFHEYFLDF